MKLINYRQMPENECGYCKFCGEKTVYECDDVNGEKKIAICEDCAKEFIK